MRQAASFLPFVVLTSLATLVISPSVGWADDGERSNDGAKDASAGARDIQHNGLILGAGVGPVGCTRSVCADEHDSQVSYGFEGIFGWNFLGFVELGAQGGWGRVVPQIDGNTNALSLYGVREGDRDAVADQLGLTASELTVSDAESQFIHAAPVVRVHFPRRGRVAAYAGVGVGYLLYRNDYSGPDGDFRLDWHGVQIPVQAGLAIYPAKRIALTVTGSYRFAWYAAGRLDHPRASGAAPAGALADAVDGAGLDFDAQLPHTWSAMFGLRITLLSRPYVL